jgi:phosphoglycerate dehydrogenase-like enzyme
VFPPRERLTILFARAAYRLRERFLARDTGIDSFEVRTLDELERRIGEADVLVISGLWRNHLLDRAPRLRFIQSVSAGTDQYDRAKLGGKTLLIVGLGGIGSRLAHLAKAFGLRVVGVKRNPATGGEAADSVHAMADLPRLLPQADFVVLTCPLNADTERIIDAEALARMRKSAYLVNAARGGCVDEPALVKALQEGTIAGAALDVTAEEPLAAGSALWEMANVLITPHTAGETRRYEDNVLDILVENLDRLWSGAPRLRNEIA